MRMTHPAEEVVGLRCSDVGGREGRMTGSDVRKENGLRERLGAAYH